MIGEIIKKQRVARAMTIYAVSSQAGVSLSHLGRIERGERNPSGYVLRKLSNPLGFTEIELFKLAGLLSSDEVDDRMEKFKVEMKRETYYCLALLLNKIDTFNAKEVQ